MNKPSLNIKSAPSRLINFLGRLRQYSVVGFLVLVAGLYAFLVFSVNDLVNQQPSSDAINSQVKSANIPYIDEKVVKQLKSLQDNSVSVQALFNEARNNPFQE